MGDWTVKVVIDGDIVYTKTFNYYTANKQEIYEEPVQLRLQHKETSECELQLRHFSGEMKNSPNDPYIKFMLEKWGKRCSSE